MQQLLAAVDVVLWALFGLSVALDLYSLYLSIRLVLGFRGRSPVAFVPLLGYVLRIVTSERSLVRMALLCAAAAVIHVIIAFGAPALVRFLLKKRRD
ncbi:hypothetical protein [Sorangium sp. So ce1000]|uniref:hypothetical protein n=1 Tax=Sorangium sp. So ce1000 TaxID=3133325 RepID=UPI003F615AF1